MMPKFKTWLLFIGLLIASAVVGASESPCPDNLLPPPQEIPPSDFQQIRIILYHLGHADFVPEEKEIAENLTRLRRYRHLIVRDLELRHRLLRAIHASQDNLKKPDDVQGVTVNPGVKQFQDLIQEIILEDLTPLVIKPEKIVETPENVNDAETTEVAEEDTPKFQIDAASLANDLQKYLSDSETAFRGITTKDNAELFEQWLASWEKQGQYLKFDGEKFYFAASPEGAITAARFKRQWDNQNMQQRLDETSLFFLGNRELYELFTQQPSLKDIGKLWQKFNLMGRQFTRNQMFFNVINAVLAYQVDPILSNLQKYSIHKRISTFNELVIIKRLIEIYNLYLEAIDERIGQILRELCLKTQERFPKFSTMPRLNFTKMFPSINNRTSEVRLILEREQIPSWKLLLAANQDEARPEYRYLLRLIKAMLETLEEDPHYNSIAFMIYDINLFLDTAVAKGKFQEYDTLMAGGFVEGRDDVAEVVLDAESFTHAQFLTLSALIHELHHASSYKTDLKFTPAKIHTFGNYPNGFVMSEVSARIKQLEHLTPVLERLAALLEQNPGNPQLIRQGKDILVLFEDAFGVAVDLNQKALDIFQKLAAYFEDAQSEFEFEITEYDPKIEKMGTRTSYNYFFDDHWSRPAPGNKNHFRVEISVPDIGTFSYRVPLDTARADLDPIFTPDFVSGKEIPAENIRASLKKQIQTWILRLQQWKQDLAPYEKELDQWHQKFK